METSSLWYRSKGFTLVELVMVMIITGILATYAVGRYFTAAETTGASQAQRFARDLRHAQMLALTWSRQLCVNVTGGGYSVHGTGAGSPPACNTGAVTDPATGAAFSVALQDGATLAGPGTVRFDSMGRPSNGSSPVAAASTYTLSGGGSWTITVNPVTGLVTAAP